MPQTPGRSWRAVDRSIGGGGCGCCPQRHDHGFWFVLVTIVTQGRVVHDWVDEHPPVGVCWVTNVSVNLIEAAAMYPDATALTLAESSTMEA